MPVGREDALKELDELLGWYKAENNNGRFADGVMPRIIHRFKSAVDRVCPANHHYRQEADDIARRAREPAQVGFANEIRSDRFYVLPMANLLEALRADVAGGRLNSIYEAVRLETCGDMLEQATFLVREGYLAAGAVLAGGALETTLHNLCNAYGISVSGDPSISKYNDAISQARNKGLPVPYDGNDAKLVTAWGGQRNTAAHTPAEFVRDMNKGTVELLISGVRDFLNRVV
jgi:hypothetical protein